MNRLNREVKQADKDVSDANYLLEQFDGELCTLGVKGQRVLELWEDYDRLQRLKEAQKIVDLTKFRI